MVSEQQAQNMKKFGGVDKRGLLWHLLTSHSLTDSEE
jgi:hypothetical protein